MAPTLLHYARTRHLFAIAFALSFLGCQATHLARMADEPLVQRSPP